MGNIRPLLDEMKEVIKDEDLGEIKRLHKLLQLTTRQGIRSFKEWEAVQPMIEQERRLVESETRLLKDLGQNIPLEQVLGLAGRLFTSVKNHVKDPEQLAAIGREFAEICS